MRWTMRRSSKQHGSGALRPRPRLWRRQHNISVGEMLVVVRSHRLAHFMASREVTSQLQRLLERTPRGEISTWSVIGENPLDRAKCPRLLTVEVA